MAIVDKDIIHTRYGTVSRRTPMEGRKLGYVEVMDCYATMHIFYEREFINKFPDLSEGDTVKILYTSGPSRGGWHIAEVNP